MKINPNSAAGFRLDTIGYSFVSLLQEVPMPRPSSLASPLYPNIRFAFTDHPITVWAGAILLRLSFELICLRADL